MTPKNDNNLTSKLAAKVNEERFQDMIQGWWFDDSLYLPCGNEIEQTRTTLKKYYAFIQLFYHENFRKSDTKIDEYLRELIETIESEEQFQDCPERDKRLKALVMGSACRRLGQIKAERYQPAETEHARADYYLEQDTSFLGLIDWAKTDAGEEFVITLLFLLNKAKYFRDIAEKDVLRADSSYCRAIMLFQDIKDKIEQWLDRFPDTSSGGVLARIYVCAWLNIAQIYRLQQERDLTRNECVDLVLFCIQSIEGDTEKERVQKIVYMLPEIPQKDNGMKQKPIFHANKCIQGNRTRVNYLFEEYILQALLQLGISYRDRVDFNGSLEGHYWVKQAMCVFLVLGILDCVKDDKEADTGEMEALFHTLQTLDLNNREDSGKFAKQVQNICIPQNSILKNADAQNNLAVCLKKLKHYTAAMNILKDPTLEGNKFAEYNLCKCYLESGVTEKEQFIHQYCYGKDPKNDKSIYIYPEKPERSNYKWLFLYARYLFAQKQFDEAEELFSLIRKGRIMQWDSLELKAAYLEAQCQMQRGKYLSAIDSLRNIHDSLEKMNDPAAGYRDSDPKEPGNEGPRRLLEIRTEIDLGWCLIMEDSYREALDVYEALLTYLVWNRQLTISEKKPSLKHTLERLKEYIDSVKDPENGTDRPYPIKWFTISGSEQKKILHNLYDCKSYLLSPSDDVTLLIEEICKPDSEEDPDVYMRFLKGIRSLNKLKREDGTNVDDNGQMILRREWKQLCDDFGAALQMRPLDIVTYSCWAIAKVNYCMLLPRTHKDFTAQKEQLLSGLVSSTTAITMKSYIEVAHIVLHQSGDDKFLDICSGTVHDKKMALERAFLELFCHVNLRKNGTNQAFMNLMTDQNFHSIELLTRARLLANIVELYGDILQVKTRLRITYDNLSSYGTQDNHQKDKSPIICQYTRLSTLKGILPKMSQDTEKETRESEPRFRMSNAARMNDTSEGSIFKMLCEEIASPEITGIKSAEYQKIIRKYIDNSSGYKTTDEISSYDSDVYIASFSMNRDNFGLWSNYADKEKGCIIGFDKSFFDLVDQNSYSILDDEAEENALYRILYMDEHNLLNDGSRETPASQKDPAQGKNVMETIKACIPRILEKLSRIEKMLPQDGDQEYRNQEISPAAAGVVRAFIIDRLNEIRFLFKSVSYEYEEEVRMLRCSQTPETGESDLYPVPWLYINVEKKLDNLTLILGSRVELQQVKELSVWAKSTGRVKQVIWSGLNRV